MQLRSLTFSLGDARPISYETETEDGCCYAILDCSHGLRWVSGPKAFRTAPSAQRGHLHHLLGSPTSSTGEPRRHERRFPGRSALGTRQGLLHGRGDLLSASAGVVR